MNMVERVAKALYDRPRQNWPEHRTQDLGLDQNCFRLLARAAIEAMREPTPAMIHAPTMIMGGGWQNSHSDRETWEAMIEAALSESEQEKAG